jgi:hypothetical protein
LLLIVAVTFFCANVAIKPAEGVNGFDWLGHKEAVFLGLYLIIGDIVEFVKSLPPFVCL